MMPQIGAATCFETPRWRAAPQHEAEERATSKLSVRRAVLGSRYSSHHFREWPSALRKSRKRGEVTANECFLFCTRPALHLPLGGDGVDNPVEPLREYQRHRATLRRIAAVRSSIVFRDPLLQARPRGPGVIAVVGASQDVEVGSIIHGVYIPSASDHPTS